MKRSKVGLELTLKQQENQAHCSTFVYKIAEKVTIVLSLFRLSTTQQQVGHANNTQQSDPQRQMDKAYNNIGTRLH